MSAIQMRTKIQIRRQTQVRQTQIQEQPTDRQTYEIWFWKGDENRSLIMHNMQKMQNMKKMQNVQNMQKMQHIQNVPNIVSVLFLRLHFWGIYNATFPYLSLFCHISMINSRTFLAQFGLLSDVAIQDSWMKSVNDRLMKTDCLAIASQVRWQLGDCNTFVKT